MGRAALTLDDGAVVQSNVGGEPFSYVHGESELIPALEQALEGRQANERLTLSIPPEDAYGAPDPGALREVPVDRVSDEMREAGMWLSAAGYNGAIRVSEVRPDAVGGRQQAPARE
ncbi:MAG: FKBP-type peptidyl-prolyl cis-trans isomerase, partial [Gemmobacter sp.]